ncbi:MAG: hypothetical protein [Wendovervirus sonii]|uniref:Uncharacterized protein n=1 Tax=phage Lak_Megaphage_Sonny TaxID=3109229 RepID=A0ABZ0Z2J3_9CAUD|nr:MAG: hypothetical protein [phage Lak_Megaphage_Sonny]
MKIQSQSDIITNSSSEVFIMPTETAQSIDASYDSQGYIYIDVIYPDFLAFNFWRLKGICDVLGINVIRQFGKDVYEMNEKEREQFIEEITPKFLEFFGEEGKYAYVDIEDHFEECEDAYYDARHACIWFENRH